MMLDNGLDVLVDARLKPRKVGQQAVERFAVQNVQLGERRRLGTGRSNRLGAVDRGGMS